MTGQEVYNFFVSRGVTNIFHANSVKTSLSIVRLGGIASRRLVESSGLPQTNQITDDIDRKYGIWGDVFMDVVDIHRRVSNRNHYGPVLFVLGVEVLRDLPADAQVLVTRLNPSKWDSTSCDEERYFLSLAELEAGAVVGNFDQMLVVRTPSEVVGFGRSLQSIILDEPKLTNGTSPEYDSAEIALNTAVATKGSEIKVTRRQCAPCGCIASYSEKSTRIPWFYGFR